MTQEIKIAESDDRVEIIISSVPISGQNRKAWWGWMSTGDMLTEAQIIVLQGSADFATGSTITADFRAGNAAPMYLYMAERSTEPAKTKWYGSGIDNGNIAPGATFYALGVVAGWRLYRSTNKTQFSTTTEFRVS